MTEDQIVHDLAASQIQLRTWWENKIPENSYPKKLANKIKFLRGYLGAIQSLKKDDVVADVVNRMTDSLKTNSRRVI